MKILVFICAASAIILSCNNKTESKGEINDEKVVPAPARDSLLITDSSWGLIERNMGIEELKKIFGSAISDQRICGAECVDSVDVTFIYPDKENEVVIYWEDSAYHKKMMRIEAGRPSSPYYTKDTIHINSTLKDLLKVNGKPIRFSGFGWDYGGYVQSYNGGRYENSPVNFRLDLVTEGTDDLFGDTDINTDMPSVKKNLDKIKVAEISLSFYKGN